MFQAQYYDMPRQPGARIESPDTLGRKCWAFAYLAAAGAPLLRAVEAALEAAGLGAAFLVSRYEQAGALSMGLCERVLANCFVNATYDPARNGTCPGAVAAFRYLGFERENLPRGFPLAYPFF